MLLPIPIFDPRANLWFPRCLFQGGQFGQRLWPASLHLHSHWFGRESCCARILRTRSQETKRLPRNCIVASGSAWTTLQQQWRYQLLTNLARLSREMCCLARLAKPARTPPGLDTSKCKSWGSLSVGHFAGVSSRNQRFWLSTGHPDAPKKKDDVARLQISVDDATCVNEWKPSSDVLEQHAGQWRSHTVRLGFEQPLQIHHSSFHRNHRLLLSRVGKSFQSQQDVWVAPFRTQCFVATEFVFELCELFLQHAEALVDDGSTSCRFRSIRSAKAARAYGHRSRVCSQESLPEAIQSYLKNTKFTKLLWSQKTICEQVTARCPLRWLC